MRPIVIAIVGNAGSGKTHMSEFLQDKLNIPVIVSYTTRPMRKGEVNGKDHIFINDRPLPPKSEMLAYTLYGKQHYFSLFSQIPENGICSYVIDEISLEELCRCHSDKYLVVPVYVKCDEKVLIKRGISPERMHRDQERRKLRPEFYDCIITNNGTVEEFQEQILSKVNEL